MRHLIYITFLTTALSLNTISIAADNKPPAPTKPQATEYQRGLILPKPISEKEFEKVIQEFKQYLEKLDPQIKEEIKDYRSKMQKLNQEKMDLYKKLSEAAQIHLKREREFKKKLPWMERKKLIEAEETKQIAPNMQDTKTQKVEIKK
jgi:Skp family chaperone for outer membrane proteins